MHRPSIRSRSRCGPTRRLTSCCWCWRRCRCCCRASTSRAAWQWRWRMVIALGITWMLDGLEVTLVGSIGPVLMEPATLHLTAGQVGGTGTAYLAGAVSGALVFGRLTDLYGRKRLFLITLAVYLT